MSRRLWKQSNYNVDKSAGNLGTREQRLAYAEKHITLAAEEGWLETTQSARIVETYGLPPEMVARLKKLKAKYRNELSFLGGDGK